MRAAPRQGDGDSGGGGGGDGGGEEKKGERFDENADGGRGRERENGGSERAVRSLEGERARDGGGGEKSLAALRGLERPMPWTGGALLANIQPSPCSTTTSTHTAPATGRARPAASSSSPNRPFDKQQQDRLWAEPLKTLLPICRHTATNTPHSTNPL